jgi:hypothetical protein
VRSRRLAACTIAFALVAAGCSGGSGIDRQASDQLVAAVARVRAAARAHDVAGANARLGDVRNMVAFLRARGDLSGAAAGRILGAADGVATDLLLIPTTTTTTTSTTTTLPPPAPERKKGHGRGGGNGDNGD